MGSVSGLKKCLLCCSSCRWALGCEEPLGHKSQSNQALQRATGAWIHVQDYWYTYALNALSTKEREMYKQIQLNVTGGLRKVCPKYMMA